MTDPERNPETPRADLESTSMLFERMRAGDARARELLFARALPALTQWAHQRLPLGARDLHDTEDLVQSTLVRAFHRLEEFEPRGSGAFLAYLRQILLNTIRDELRRKSRRPVQQTLDDAAGDELPAGEPSALEAAIGAQTLERYERALSTLPAEHQEAVLMRLELDMTYAEIADALGAVSAEAARKLIGRALLRLAELMRDDDGR